VKVLIAGGAGYLGSTVASACLDAGITPVILDNLVTGTRQLAAGRKFYEGDIADGPLVDRIFAEHPDIGVVIHCAALIVVPDSVADPVGYYRANVVTSLEFIAHLLRNGCARLIFSSSAAIYRASEDLTVDEESPVDPQSPYARTKAICEAMFADIAVRRGRRAGPQRLHPAGVHRRRLSHRFRQEELQPLHRRQLGPGHRLRPRQSRQRLVTLPRRQQPCQVLAEPPPLRHMSEQVIETGPRTPPADPAQANTPPAWSSLITGFELIRKSTYRLR
jgi:NAD(P)-dependent dehydrogenase (short-subunit alcohol dehydrogenase family)